MMFNDRVHAGQLLAEQLKKYHGASALVLGIPRGGVVVAHEVARILELPLDIVIARKIGAPGNPEFALGAITADGVRWVDDEVIVRLGVDPQTLEYLASAEQGEAMRREREFRQWKEAIAIAGKIIIVVDDGIATGATVRAALMQLQEKSAQKIVLAVPVISRETSLALSDIVDEIVRVHTADDLGAVGEYYKDFRQVSDEEVKELLQL